MLIKTKWTFKKLHKEALKSKTRMEFQKRSPSAYQVAWKKKILDQICSHMKSSASEEYTLEELKLEALKHKTRGEFSDSNHSAYSSAINQGVLDEICSHMEWVRTYWTYEMLKTEALKHNTRSEFLKSSYSAYQIAYGRGILEEICDHMGPSLTEAYTLEELQQEALKYKTRGEFSKNNPAYVVAHRRKVLDLICSHMAPSKGSSFAEKELLNIIKSTHVEAKKFKDNSVNIPDRPYIHGFEIDILVGKLGIEYDGKYYHSFEGLKNSHPNWPDEAIKNYHEIKDDWFAAQGIKILHIKEEDWIKDKNYCIKKCMKFLKNS